MSYQLINHLIYLKTVLVFAIITFAAFSLTALWMNPNTEGASYHVKISKSYSFVDSQGVRHVVGTVRNEGYMPVQVQVALKTEGISGAPTIIANSTFGKTIYPFTESPFKLDIGKESIVLGSPYVKEALQVSYPYYQMLKQNYTTMNATIGKNLVGVIKNEGSIALHNVSVYASVHQENGTQVDSVRTATIPLLRPGEQVKYIANPDPAVQAQAVYFSCAGFDVDAPITTMDIGDGKFLPYTLESAAKIIDFGYDAATDTLSFSADHYNPSGGTVKLSIPEISGDHDLTIYLDGIIDKNAKISKNGKTIGTEIFVPPETHEIKIKGVLAKKI
jgi:hypothetical protein